MADLRLRTIKKGRGEASSGHVKLASHPPERIYTYVHVKRPRKSGPAPVAAPPPPVPLLRPPAPTLPAAALPPPPAVTSPAPPAAPAPAPCAAAGPFFPFPFPLPRGRRICTEMLSAGGGRLASQTAPKLTSSSNSVRHTSIARGVGTCSSLRRLCFLLPPPPWCRLGGRGSSSAATAAAVAASATAADADGHGSARIVASPSWGLNFNVCFARRVSIFPCIYRSQRGPAPLAGCVMAVLGVGRWR